jgi:SAM-dependent methyltransferase
MDTEWYVEWFNSPWYHLLYNHRNEDEANFFINNLCHHLRLPQGARIWDVACGKGRHAAVLAKKGFNVTGTDLSPNSIAEASQITAENMEFLLHDMREPFRKNYFDAVFNLFTSIGYFKEAEDNVSVFRNVSYSLKKGGVFVIDFFNSSKVVAKLKPEYVEKRDDVIFNITKKVEGNSIIKKIEFEADGQQHQFEESVTLLKMDDFQKFAAGTGLELQNTFGNYYLEPFNEKTSDRLILIFKK